MSIRPVDLQVLVPKSTEMSRTSQTELQRGTVEQQQFGQQFNKKLEHEEQGVVQLTKTEHNDINADESGKNKYDESIRKRRKKKKGGANEKQSEKSTTSNASMFDIKI